jgi:hypothetical protein
MRALRTQNWLVPIMGGLIGTAWIALFLWEQSPYGRYLDHGRWTDLGFAAAICRALPGGDVLLPGLLYAGGWLLMSAAVSGDDAANCRAIIAPVRSSHCRPRRSR